MAKNHPINIAIGKNKGHQITKFKLNQKQAKRIKPANRKGKLGKRVALIRQIVSQVSGVSSYEKRVLEFLKAGSMKDSKKALKVAKKALGTHRRAKVKRELLMNALRQQQKKGK